MHLAKELFDFIVYVLPILSDTALPDLVQFVLEADKVLLEVFHDIHHNRSKVKRLVKSVVPFYAANLTDKDIIATLPT